MDTLDALLESLKLLHVLGGPSPDFTIGSLSCSGGEASLMGDLVEKTGLTLRELGPPEEAAKVRATLPDMVTISNPLDYHTFTWGGDQDSLTETYAAMLGCGFGLTCLLIDLPRPDLYAMNWNPVASAADFGGDRAKDDYLVYALEQRNGVSTQTIAPDIQRELDKLMDCDLLVLNFPIYWFSVPAIMKGWFDRVIVSGLCYGGGVRFYDRGGLRGKRVYTAATLGGQPHMFGENAVHGPMNTMLSPLLRGTLGYTGMEVLDPFLAWHVPISLRRRGKR